MRCFSKVCLVYLLSDATARTFGARCPLSTKPCRWERAKSQNLEPHTQGYRLNLAHAHGSFLRMSPCALVARISPSEAIKNPNTMALRRSAPNVPDSSDRARGFQSWKSGRQEDLLTGFSYATVVNSNKPLLAAKMVTHNWGNRRVAGRETCDLRITGTTKSPDGSDELSIM